MTAIMRRTVRASAATLGALAIVTGTAACGGLLGGNEDGDGGTTTEEESPSDAEEDADDDMAEQDAGTGDGAASEDEGSSDDEGMDEDASDGDSDDAASGEALSEDDLTAVGDRFYEFLEAAANADGEAACGLVSHPTTGEPLSGPELAGCIEGFESEAGEQPIDPSMMDAIDRSMIEGVDNGDGTAGIELLGEDGGVVFVQGEDGQWYIDGSQYL
ncbi:hypothetical protein [Brachybacterium saurashtrense]|uniref:Secreted protein n=1 Tax=Brachybacterium saurashtrense TaxID=556288 RepID=A0A345YMM1_9MICO|nr:hypothetical protein [Brachybacterium saurashtrense]AXK45173.1 hypothetical protein DWV08_05765 [Brachybacterium saurashtrense]RRR22073.1 hypothetical protein DXU92_12310 [Brachybacterium saurashtrense]